MTKARIPPTWLVLLPGLVLAAVGVRAVTAEMSASQDAARERARSVASRLARSVDALVAEYAAPLAAPAGMLDSEGLRAATEHLSPCLAATVEGGPLIGYGAPLIGMHGIDPNPAEEAPLADDALATAQRLAREPGGDSAAAALTASVAKALRGDGWKSRLLLASARHAAAARDARAAEGAMDECPVDDLYESDGTPVTVTWLALACELATARPAVNPRRAPSIFATLACWPLRTGDDARIAVLDRAEAELGAAIPPRERALRRRWEEIQSVANRAKTGARPPTVTAALGDPLRLTIWALVDIPGDKAPRRTVVSGDVPAATVEARVGGESAALAREAGVASIRLAGPGSAHAFYTAGGAPVRGAVLETVGLAAPLDAWRAEAVVAPETGVPATAWLLAAAVLATTAALLAGTLALRRAADRSARLAEERRTFLDHVAHELRTPAAAVQALSEELASGHVTADRETVYREHLLRESRRLSALVEDTLDFARLDAGRLAFRMEPADLRDVVRAAIEESDGAGRVAAQLPDEAVVRSVDAKALRRAVKNLVENAVRHGGGEGPIRVELEANGGAVSIVVADTGRGIAPEHLPRLFERFYRVPSPTHEGKGVGLGLALCREVARAHGGDVEVVSEPGKGSTFTIRLPPA